MLAGCDNTAVNSLLRHDGPQLTDDILIPGHDDIIFFMSCQLCTGVASVIVNTDYCSCIQGTWCTKKKQFIIDQCLCGQILDLTSHGSPVACCLLVQLL